jgi:hypothetical protein
VGELQRDREERMRALKKNHEDSFIENTFQPQIDERSRKIAERR